MEIYKEKQYLVFVLDDGKVVKYDFATKTAIGKSGKPVVNLKSQLSGMTINQLCDNCTDPNYGRFLKFVQSRAEFPISNIGTILSRVPRYARYEQLFSAGIDDIIGNNFSHAINDIPKAIIKLCKEHKIKLSDRFLDYYKVNPDAYQLAYKMEYVSLTDENIYVILCSELKRRSEIQPGGYYINYDYLSKFNVLINEYGYTAKALLKYIDYLKTYEAIEDMEYIMRELHDYCNMMHKISPKFDKYPRHFLTTHKIAARNYNRLKEQFDEEEFQKRIKPEMERTFGEFVFIYPKSTNEIKDEAVQQNNCVASYIKRVLDDECDILFLRHKDAPETSLVTVEVRGGVIVQASQRFNYAVTQDQQGAIDKWNRWFRNREVLANAS